MIVMGVMGARVSAIVVTFNSEKHIRGCLESLKRQTHAELDIVVVDNNSSDRTVEFARGFGVRLLENKENKGFAAANNQGAAYALERLGPDFLLLVNPDVQADGRLVGEMVRTLAANGGFGIAQGKLLLARERDLLNSAGNRLHFLYFSYCGGYREPDTVGEDAEIAVASGACMMINKDALDVIGYLFNEDFFMYHEDTDLCMRARLKGIRTALSGRAVAWHDYRFGSGKAKFYHMEKNRLFLMLQNYRASTLLLLLPAVIFTEAQVVLFSLLNGWAGQKMKSYVWLARNMDRVLASRREVQAGRLCTDAELLSVFVTDISFEEVENPGLRYVTNPLLKFYYKLVCTAVRALGKGRKGR